MIRNVFAAAVAGLFASAAAAEEVWLTMDYVTPHALPEPVASLVIGNPGIADVVIEGPQSLLLFGKAPGATNVFMLNEDGRKVDELTVRVRAAGDGVVTLQKGAERMTLQCLTRCEPTPTVGDGEAFDATLAQAQRKNAQATAE